MIFRTLPLARKKYFRTFAIPSEYGAISSVGRAPDCGSGCRGFEPHIAPQNKKPPRIGRLFVLGGASSGRLIQGAGDQVVIDGDHVVEGAFASGDGADAQDIAIYQRGFRIDEDGFSLLVLGAETAVGFRNVGTVFEADAVGLVKGPAGVAGRIDDDVGQAAPGRGLRIRPTDRKLRRPRFPFAGRTATGRKEAGRRIRSGFFS